jgi:opacity protein-like surface antigen
MFIPKPCRCLLPRGIEAMPPARVPLSADNIPALSSLPGARYKLFLSMEGLSLPAWGFYTDVNTPPFDLAGDSSVVQQIWERVAEDYAPFNLDVTTINPGPSLDVAVISIGGSWSDWYGSSAGGVAFTGGYRQNSLSMKTGFVFSRNLGSDAKYIAEAAAHEAGHLFGLQHQALWNGTTLAAAYHPGNGEWAPLMGVGYYAVRTTWHNGATSAGPFVLQDDLSILSKNVFGLRTDDAGDSINKAVDLPVSGNRLSASGRLNTSDDRDLWRFACGYGPCDITLAGSFGTNTDLVLEIRDPDWNLISVASPAESYSARIATDLLPGVYFLVASSTGGYGNLGQYTLSGTIPPESAERVNFGIEWPDDGVLLNGELAINIAGQQSVIATFPGQRGVTGLSGQKFSPLGASFAYLSKRGTKSPNPSTLSAIL